MKLLYRFEDLGNSNQYHLLTFEVIRETNCYWIVKHRPDTWIVPCGSEKRVCKGARRPFAYETEEAAAKSYARRKFRHIEALEHQLQQVNCRFRSIKNDFNIEIKSPAETFGPPHVRI